MNTLQTLVPPHESIRNVVRRIDLAKPQGGEIGIAVVVDEYYKVIGAVTDGDIRRAVCKELDFSAPVSEIMSTDPICIPEGLDSRLMLRCALEKMQARKVIADKLIVVDEQHRFVDIVNLHTLYRGEDIVEKRVAIYGMGYVGLTLAVTLAENPLFKVEGIDTNERVINKLWLGKPHFYEKGLESLLHRLLDGKAITFSTSTQTQGIANVHIVSVGTPIDDKRQADTRYLANCAEQIGAALRKNDLVICRSTVPVGTTRNFFIPLLEKRSGLSAGKDFHVAFAPERTVEGDALRELRALPQIVGGLTSRCREIAAMLFQKITATVVYVESLEAAEITKLINNSFRDLVFGFANEVAFLCDQYNIDAFDTIAAANEGYPRNPIPRPSPGVGGVCLSKDPHLYSIHATDAAFASMSLGIASRAINERGGEYVFWALQKFIKSARIGQKRLKVLIVGVAFKGMPDTSDMRFSAAVDLIGRLLDVGHEVLAYDAVVPEDEIRKLGVRPVVLPEGMRDCDAIFFMNNHTRNTEFELYAGLKAMNRPCLFFDGWKVFGKGEVESVSGVSYSTMGYLTPRADA